MLQLFDNQAIGSVGKPAIARNALWSIIIHGSVFVFLASLTLSPSGLVLPDHFHFVELVAPLPPPPLPPPPPTKAVSVHAKTVARSLDAKLTAPISIPNHIPVQETVLEAPPEVAVVAGVPGGIPGGVLSGVPGGLPTIALAPPPPEAKVPPRAEPPVPHRIEVSAEVQEAKLIRMIRPECPPMAKMARVNGAVHLKAIIDANGRITQLKVIDGNPLLVAAAREAVEKRQYRPIFLDGEPVEVATDIIVNFRLI